MKLLVFPSTVAALIIGIWLVLAFLESCLPGSSDATYGCKGTLQLTAVYACICALLTFIAAGITRVALHRFLGFDMVRQEVAAAILTSVVLVLAFYGINYFELYIGGISGLFFGWLVAGFVVSAVCLTVAGLYGRRKRAGALPPDRT